MNPKRHHAALGAALLVLAATAAEAQLTLSTSPTSNVSCAAGTCTATAPSANLNTGEIMQALKSSDLSISADAPIEVRAHIGWSARTTLSLATAAAIVFHKPLRINGAGGVALTAAKDKAFGPHVTYMPGAAMTFRLLRSRLTIDGVRHHLVRDLHDLHARLQSGRHRNYALASDVDAGPDGVYANTVIPEMYGGRFDGLGHDIVGLRIASTRDTTGTAMFGYVQDAAIRNVSLIDVSVSAAGAYSTAGALVATLANSTIAQVFSSGSVSSRRGMAGGLVGYGQYDDLSTVMSQANVEGGVAGGLIGYMSIGSVTDAMAAGAVTGFRFGFNPDLPPDVGGLFGRVYTTHVSAALAVGAVSAPRNGTVGGLVGENIFGSYRSSYWDTTTSGTRTGCGAECHEDDVILGRTTQQLRRRLRDGFSGDVWGYGRKQMLGGLPYLLALPPR